MVEEYAKKKGRPGGRPFRMAGLLSPRPCPGPSHALPRGVPAAMRDPSLHRCLGGLVPGGPGLIQLTNQALESTHIGDISSQLGAVGGDLAPVRAPLSRISAQLSIEESRNEQGSENVDPCQPSHCIPGVLVGSQTTD